MLALDVIKGDNGSVAGKDITILYVIKLNVVEVYNIIYSDSCVC